MSANTEVEQLKKRLSNERGRLMDAVNRLERDELLRPFLEGWSAKDILAHLAMAEAVNVRFAKLMLSHEQPVQREVVMSDFPDYIGPLSLDSFNAFMTEKLRASSLDDALRSLAQTRAETLEWMETLTPDELERGGQHAVWGDQTVRGMLKILVLHDKMHLQDLLKVNSDYKGEISNL